MLISLIGRGRQAFELKDYVRAREFWKNALQLSHQESNYAAMYVLNKNLGDVARSKQEALQYYENSLAIASHCGLFSHVLLRKSIKLICLAIEKIKSTIENTCATCGSESETLIQDTDALYYCKLCYEAYYDSLTVLEAEQSDALSKKINHDLKQYSIQSLLSLKPENTTCPAEIRDSTISKTSYMERLNRKAKKSELSEQQKKLKADVKQSDQLESEKEIKTIEVEQPIETEEKLDIDRVETVEKSEVVEELPEKTDETV